MTPHNAVDTLPLQCICAYVKKDIIIGTNVLHAKTVEETVLKIIIEIEHNPDSVKIVRTDTMQKKDRRGILVEKIGGKTGKMIHKDIVMTDHIRRNKKLCTDIDRLALPHVISICVYFMIKKHLQI